MCDEHWREGGSIFFYVGNEAVRAKGEACHAPQRGCIGSCALRVSFYHSLARFTRT